MERIDSTLKKLISDRIAAGFMRRLFSVVVPPCHEKGRRAKDGEDGDDSLTSRRAPKPFSSLRRKRPAGDNRCLKGSAEACPFSSSSGPIWRRLPKLKGRKMGGFVPPRSVAG